MIEVAMTLEARNAYTIAHQERARAVKSAFGWLSPSRIAHWVVSLVRIVSLGHGPVSSARG
ncbi:hypothetical protein E2K80_16765 [Rhodophyticola sp. CCM32]|uniref:hypothetical protein n=1 Tax=Rhodophyticola sp. CCM32 TaxID=2916397 RepID=UPI00107F3281|nr:hypothetical protein [Rhodophyticola sp. CCM32]QBY02188.1 hypothetical protein E2K80_16765 [Rhodophyticola sp. CCM32]